MFTETCVTCHIQMFVALLHTWHCGVLNKLAFPRVGSIVVHVSIFFPRVVWIVAYLTTSPFIIYCRAHDNLTFFFLISIFTHLATSHFPHINVANLLTYSFPHFLLLWHTWHPLLSTFNCYYGTLHFTSHVIVTFHLGKGKCSFVPTTRGDHFTLCPLSPAPFTSWQLQIIVWWCFILHYCTMTNTALNFSEAVYMGGLALMVI